MAKPGGGTRLARTQNGALFRPGELEQPGTHAVARDLRRLKGCLRRHRGELDAWRAKLELTKPAIAVLALLACLPRPRRRVLGVGLQVSREDLARWLGCCVSTVDNAHNALAERGLLQRFGRQRPVELITKARGPAGQIFDFVAYHGTPWGGRVARTHTSADCYAVSYPTPRALTLLELHDSQRRRRERPGLWKTLRDELETRCARFVDPAERPSENWSPYKASNSAAAPRFAGAAFAEAFPAESPPETAATSPPDSGGAVFKVPSDFQPPPEALLARPPVENPARRRLAGGRSGKSRRTAASGSGGGRFYGWTHAQMDELERTCALNERRQAREAERARRQR